MKSIDKNTAPSPTPSGVIVFGTDDKGKPHASAFRGEEADLAQKAAALMGMRVLLVADANHGEVAQKLPVGRVFASGKAFVPFVARPLYEQLCALGGDAVSPPDQPRRPGRATAQDQGDGDDVPAGKPGPDHPDLPQGWDALRLGSLVLATTGPQEGWFESVIVKLKGDGLVVLRWRDWPSEPQFARRRDQLALLPSEATAEG